MKTSISQLKLLVRILLGLVGLLANVEAHSFSQDVYRDIDVPAHYVKLKGYGGDNELQRKNLLENHRACFETLSAMGKNPVSLPPTGIPKHVLSVQLDIYYTANRTLTVKQSVLHSIDLNTCALTETRNHITEISSSAGKCDIDHVRRVARGVCDMSAHRMAKPGAAANAFTALPPPKLDHLPPERRKLVEEQLKKLAGKMPNAANSVGSMVATDEVRQIAGMHCTVWQAQDIPAYKLCISSLKSHSAKGLNPALPLAGPFNARIPGLLLETQTPPLTVKADEASLNQTIPESRFTIPEGFKVRSISPRELQ